jgi:alcohol oxidase
VDNNGRWRIIMEMWIMILMGRKDQCHISHGGTKSKLEQDYFNSAKGIGYESAVDIQSFTKADLNKIARWEKWIDPATGKRSDAGTGYIHPLTSPTVKSNLHLLFSTKVSRVLFEGTKAIGVEYIAK